MDFQNQKSEKVDVDGHTKRNLTYETAPVAFASMISIFIAWVCRP